MPFNLSCWNKYGISVSIAFLSVLQFVELYKKTKGEINKRFYKTFPFLSIYKV